MHLRTVKFLLFMLPATWFLGISLVSPQPMEVIAGGELEYQHACVSCHGHEARGDGVMRRYLTVQPANL